MKRYLLNPLLKGAMVVLPLLVTVWILWTAFLWLNSLGVSALTALNLNQLIFPGSGLVIMLVLLVIIGLLFQFSIISWFFQRMEKELLRFPLVKTLYGAVKDLANMFDNTQHKSQQVALVDLSDKGLGMAVGIITADSIPTVIKDVRNNSDDLVTVYLPMSYMVGGYTVFLPKDKVTPLDWTFEKAMRFALTAGVSQDKDEEELLP
ncbi:DUF502 domain-containing protein [Marinicella gelatinilytica]|uniref:DUF502 domain-containing protein n=1 Tax=Marinicella gelatinilytica TaxID=2996017 RepID=UPI002260B728|nr:DUF502 domain-containing protein [Marinicella gelatinilytica]MCX7544435.1 DUF502 domain-containing protein [Marinicella gelatinilytica]